MQLFDFIRAPSSCIGITNYQHHNLRVLINSAFYLMLSDIFNASHLNAIFNFLNFVGLNSISVNLGSICI